MGHSLRSNSAFTLLELIVVMVLLALMTSFAVPQIANFLYADQLKVAARKLVGLISESSQLAQHHQVPYVLKYIASERRFVVGREQGEDLTTVSPKGGGLRLAESVSMRDFWSWYGGTRSPEEFVIRFNKNGYVEPTVIHLQEEGGQEMSVLLSPFLGKVQIVDRYVVPDKNTLFQ